jgi:protein-S-isoprenylcysteine O-methyltransferase Ste14
MGTLLLVVASALWGLVHSLTASIKFKEAIQRALGAAGMNWYRLFYNIFSAITFLPLLALAVALPDQFLYEIPDPWVDITLIIQLMAAIVLIVGVFQTDVWSFIGLRQISGVSAESRIVTSGLYRFVRHPLYTAGLVFIWLTPAMTVNRLVLYLSLTIYIIIGATFEERKLTREFGKEYEDYRMRTPMLIPVLFRRRQN